MVLRVFFSPLHAGEKLSSMTIISSLPNSHPCSQGKPLDIVWIPFGHVFSPLHAGETRLEGGSHKMAFLTPGPQGKPHFCDHRSVQPYFSPLHAGEILNELPSAYDSLSDQTFVVQFSGSARTSAILSKVVRQGPKDFFPGHSGGVRDDPDPA